MVAKSLARHLYSDKKNYCGKKEYLDKIKNYSIAICTNDPGVLVWANQISVE